MNLAADALSNRAGADTNDLKNHCPMWTLCDVPDQLLALATPNFPISAQAMQEKFKQNNGKTQNISDCLKSADGCLEALNHMLRRFMQMSASRVIVDEDGNERLASLPIYKRYNHPVFSH